MTRWLALFLVGQRDHTALYNRAGASSAERER